ncbi:MAG: hypothetical protein FWH11_05110 [Micrococcales bacterium]|nr:hypothetical protein [Micrococcales bacterium]
MKSEKSPRRRLWWTVSVVAAAAVVAASVYGLVHYWTTARDRGLYADATGTAGWTTPAENVAAVASLVGLPLGMAVLLVGTVLAIRGSGTDRDADNAARTDKSAQKEGVTDHPA